MGAEFAHSWPQTQLYENIELVTGVVQSSPNEALRHSIIVDETCIHYKTSVINQQPKECCFRVESWGQGVSFIKQITGEFFRIQKV